MQKNSFAFKKIIWLLSLIIAVISLLSFSSCNGKKAKDAACVKLTKAQIQKWINKGYTDTTKPNYIASLRFQTAYAGPGTVFRVFVIGQRKDGSLVNESLTELAPVDTCNKSHINLPAFIFVGTVPADWSDLGVLKNDGKVIDSLEYLQMTPYAYLDPGSKFKLLAYTPYIIKKGGVKSAPELKAYDLLPCPPCPNCKEPCPPPEGCIAPCTQASIDTTDN